MLPLASI